MMKKKEAIKCPEDVLRAVIFKISKFPDEFSVELYKKMGYPIECTQCHDPYDPEDPDKVELLQVTATVMFNFQTREGLVTLPHPWTALYCKHCMLAVFGRPADTGVAHMFH
ncbi:MAG: hypothetical protein PHO19_03010 [Candidatus Pacebacteria bacterium]|nr:hypothetical protein [Candidatus Paceibacterota bacterium]